MNHASSTLDPLFLTFEQFAALVLAFLPTLMSAAAVLAAGFLVAWLLKVLVLRIGAAMGKLVARAAGGPGTRHVRLPWPLSVILANIVFWLSVAFFLAVSTRILGLTGVADWIEGAARHLPHATAAAALTLGGYMLAVVARDGVVRMGERYGVTGDPRVLGAMVFYLINLIAVLAALRQLGIDLVLVRSLLLIVASAVCGGIAFAFGMGASASLDNIIAGHYVRRTYRRGQRVRVGSVEGEILELTPTAVVLDSHLGRTLVPARRFNQDVSVLLGQEETGDAE